MGDHRREDFATTNWKLRVKSWWRPLPLLPAPDDTLFNLMESFPRQRCQMRIEKHADFMAVGIMSDLEAQCQVMELPLFDNHTKPCCSPHQMVVQSDLK